MHGFVGKRYYEPSDESMWTHYCGGNQHEEKAFQEPLDTSQPIGVLFKVIDYGVQYASKVNTPFTLAQVMRYHIMLQYSQEYTHM